MRTVALTLLTLSVATLVGRSPLAAQRRNNVRMPANADAAARPAGISVYVNEVSMGDLDYLKDIPAVRVLELRWLSPFEAASRFGPTEGQAAIIVTLKRGG